MYVAGIRNREVSINGGLTETKIYLDSELENIFGDCHNLWNISLILKKL